MTSPSSMHETQHSKLCTGTTQWDGMGWTWEGGPEQGDTCTPMADSYQCMAKTTIL